MSRLAMTRLSAVLPLVLAALSAGAQPGSGSPDPHVDLGVVPGSCLACHKGHGVSGSPMLPGPLAGGCLDCHDTQARLEQKVRQGLVAGGMRPALLGQVLSKPYQHPMDPQNLSQFESGVTCTSCHSPHRAMRGRRNVVPGFQLASPKNPNRFEVELCLDCHGSLNVQQVRSADIGPLISPRNPSFHPLEAPAVEVSPSLIPEISGRYINCTDCHGNSNLAGVRGPHGSDVPFLLRFGYTTDDGSLDSETTYRLCYTCHRHEKILDESSPFPLHRLHLDEGASCSTCHNPHGSIRNRGLIRFGERLGRNVISPAPSGRLDFQSDGPGSGECYLTCHGVEHDPMGYGLDVLPGSPALFPRRPGAGR